MEVQVAAVDTVVSAALEDMVVSAVEPQPVSLALVHLAVDKRIL
jgi:hypothetical protein